jgi:non-lysosomal glucosylceramidase
MNTEKTIFNIPSQTWQRDIGKGWEKPYTVRYPSNLDDGPWHGMPLGGLGAGCIGRSSKGDFNLWHLDGGEHTFASLPACQFSVYEETADGQSQAYALCTEVPADGSLKSWQYYPQNGGTYHALYPRSWFVYEGILQSQLSCEQFSPIWAGNYQESSYPLVIFEWTAHNPTDQPITLSFMFTWQNTVGWFTNKVKSPTVQVRDDGSPVYEYQPAWEESQGNFNRLIEDFHRLGIVMSRLNLDEQMQEGEGQMAIATFTGPGIEVNYHARWAANGTGEELWKHFAKDGALLDEENDTPAKAGEQIGCAISVKFTVRPGKTRKIPFFLAWDLPVTEFAEGTWAYRRYTDFYGRNGKNAWSMVRTAMKHYQVWQENIVQWQTPILENPDLPDWLKMALFNELYDLSSGGTLWSAADERDPKGQFAVLECIDYRWYESLDVRLYGSFGLLQLWPELEKSIILAFARSIHWSDSTPRIIGYNQAPAVRKIAGATPHDLGAPNEHPWEKTNYTSYQDCNLWKDLPADLVLQIYRDFLLTGADDYEFLWECWGAIVETLDYLKTFDLDNDGIPENSGAPDQTFDDWRMLGVSAYCGGLWIAALESAIAIGEILQNHPRDIPCYPTEEFTSYNQKHSNHNIASQIAIYQTWLAQARPIYQAKLWNGQYYKLDSDSGSPVVMADQLCGEFYAQLLKLPNVVPTECTTSALKTIYQACFLNFHAGQFGLANGVLIDGSPLNPKDTHPLEVWTGINFGIAALMIKAGLSTEGLTIAETVVKQIYENGLQFRTPEAITAAGTFRASHYLRPMAIWAIYLVLTATD